jgi:hypothetical protein
VVEPCFHSRHAGPIPMRTCRRRSCANIVFVLRALLECGGGIPAGVRDAPSRWAMRSLWDPRSSPSVIPGTTRLLRHGQAVHHGPVQRACVVPPVHGSGQELSQHASRYPPYLCSAVLGCHRTVPRALATSAGAEVPSACRAPPSFQGDAMHSHCVRLCASSRPCRHPDRARPPNHVHRCRRGEVQRTQRRLGVASVHDASRTGREAWLITLPWTAYGPRGASAWRSGSGAMCMRPANG